MELTLTRNEEEKQRHLKYVFDGSPVMVNNIFYMLLTHADVRTRVACCSGQLGCYDFRIWLSLLQEMH